MSYTASDEQILVKNATDRTVPTTADSRIKVSPSVPFTTKMVKPLDEFQRPSDLAFSRLSPVYAEPDPMAIVTNVAIMVASIAVVAGLLGIVMDL